MPHSVGVSSGDSTDALGKRKAINERYRAAFEAIEGIEMMPYGNDVVPNYWMTCIRIDPDAFGADREQIRLALEQIDAESRPVWKPLHLQPLFKGATVVGGAVAEGVFAQGLCLPSGSTLSPIDQDRIIETLLQTPLIGS